MFRRKKHHIYATYYEIKDHLSFVRNAKHIFSLITDFDADYLGQREVILYPPVIGDETKISRQEAESHWIQSLRNKKTSIESITAFDVSQDLLDAIAEQPQIKRIIIDKGKFHDIASLSKLHELEYLMIDTCPVEIDFSPLVNCKKLKVLNILARKPLNYESVGQLIQLEGLWFGTAMEHVSVKVENLDFLRGLKNLKRLRFDVRPMDSDLSPALSSNQLEEGWYLDFRGQKPTAEEMAKSNPAFSSVYEDFQRRDTARQKYFLS